MFCGKCGTKNDSDARFCAGCGAPLRQNPYTQQNPYIQQNPYMQQGQNSRYRQKQYGNSGVFKAPLFLAALIMLTVVTIYMFTQTSVLKQLNALTAAAQSQIADLMGLEFIVTIVNVAAVIAFIASAAVLIALWLIVFSEFWGSSLRNIGAVIAHTVLIIYGVIMLAVIVIAVYFAVWFHNLVSMTGSYISDASVLMAGIIVIIVIVCAICILYFVFYMKAAAAAKSVSAANGKFSCSGYVPVFAIVMACIGAVGLLGSVGVQQQMSNSMSLIYVQSGGTSAGSGTGIPAVLLLMGVLSLVSQFIFAIWILKYREKK